MYGMPRGRHGWTGPGEDVMAKPAALAFLIKEFEEMLPPTIFFAIGFNLILLSTNLVLRDYGVRFSSVMLAIAYALVVGKGVLLASSLPFFRWMDTRPLIQPVLFKSAIYWVAVFAVRVLEQLVEYFVHGGTFRDLPDHIVHHYSWDRFMAIQLWILVLFLVYTFISELNTLFGGEQDTATLYLSKA